MRWPGKLWKQSEQFVLRCTFKAVQSGSIWQETLDRHAVGINDFMLVKHEMIIGHLAPFAAIYPVAITQKLGGDQNLLLTKQQFDTLAPDQNSVFR